MRKQKNARHPAYFCVILILVLVILISGLRILESTVFYDGQEQEVQRVSKSKTVEGVDYFPRQDITVMLVMGIDQEGPVKSSESYTNPGAADMIMLAIFDEKEESIRVLTLNRDTMLEMPVLGIGGRQAGTAYGQLALAHTYGNGLESSCENTRNAVSAFLGGIRIDYYVSMNMDAIGLLNDAVGGVSVTVVDDFSAVDATIPMGQTLLRGEQARHYLQIRAEVGNQLNLSRMERHRTYLKGFAEAARFHMETDSAFVANTYAEVSPYVVTDCSVTVLTNMMERYGKYTLQEVVSPEGENILGQEYYEFFVDEAQLEKLVLRLFYAPK